MTLSRRLVLELATGAVAFAPISRGARAQTYPMRPVRIMSASPLGGRPTLLRGLSHNGFRCISARNS
jgi:hypothetical protein